MVASAPFSSHSTITSSMESMPNALCPNGLNSIEKSLSNGENVYLRGFGSFIIKKRAKKVARNISKNTSIIIPAHNIPSFKPAKVFVNEVKHKVK